MKYYIKKFDCFSEKLCNDWRYLSNKSEPSGYSSSIIWCKTWWKYFGKKYILDIHVVYSKDIAVCLMPMYRYGNSLFPIGTYPDSFDNLGVLSVDDKALEFLWHSLVSTNTSFELRYLKSESIVAQTLIKVLYSSESTYYSSIVDLNPYTTLASFKPKKKLRDDIKRCKNRIGELFEGGQVTLKYHTDSSEAFDEFIECHLHRWDGGPLLDLNVRNFWRDLYLNSDMLVLVSLEISEKSIAWMLCIEDAGVSLTSIFPAYLKEYDKYSPGKVLCFELLESSILKGIETFDFGRGAENYKFWFNHGQYTLVNIRRSSSVICKVVNNDRLRLINRKLFS